jgi:phytol kinase
MSTIMMMLIPEEPLHRNLLAAAATVVYVKVAVGICDWAVSCKVVAPRVSRKCIHLAAGAWIVFWPIFSKEHWTWRLNILVPLVYTVQLFVKGAILRDPNNPDVQTMTWTGDPTELSNGPILFTVIMNLVGLFCFREQVGVIVMSCLGFGDGIAPLVGYYLPSGYFPTYPFGESDKKTLSGSLGFVVASVMGYFIMRFVIDEDGSSKRDITQADGTIMEEFMLILQVATLRAITEGICGPFDNPCIALSATFAYMLLTVTRAA